MNLKAKKTTIAAAVAAIIGVSATLPNIASAATLGNGFYDMIINNTPYVSSNYVFGSDGAWNSSFTFSCLPGSKGCGSSALYDDTAAQPTNGRYAGNADGVQGTVGIRVENGVITGTGKFEFDTIPGTAGGAFTEYTGPNNYGLPEDSTGFTGNIDLSGNLTLTTTGILGTVGDFPSLLDARWNVNNFNGGTGTGTNFVGNPVNNNTAYDTFSTGNASNASGTINGAAYDGTTAILVKGGTIGGDWGGFLGAQYFEVWNVGFSKTGDLTTVPVPAAVWLFGSGLMGLVGVARRRKSKS